MKDLLKFGKALDKAQQKEIMGGRPSVPELCAEGTMRYCSTEADCCGNEVCEWTTLFQDENGNWSTNSWQSVGWETQLRCR